jgi:predicted TIM-barrel fold metal-dependent hydrolase
MLIDCHTHAFADKIAEKAVDQLIHYYQLPTTFGGTLDDLLAQATLAHLDAFILLVAATKPEQVKPAHDWVISLAARLPAHPKIVRFGTYHTDDPHWLTEINRLRAAGIRGIKLHPEFQGIDLADPRLDALFEEIAGEFTLMVHVGDPRKTPNNLSTPAKVAALKRKFPKLTIIAAHLGGYCYWEEAFRDLAGLDVFFDTSSALPYIDPALLRRLIDRHGIEHLLMGSDYPLRSPLQELEILESYRWLTSSQKDAICGGNCAHLLGLACQTV